MTKRSMRSTLLQAASILVVSGGTALAAGLEVGVGSDTGIGASVGDDGVSANVGTDTSVGVGSGDGGIDIGVGADAGADVVVGADPAMPEGDAAAARARADADVAAGVDTRIEGDGDASAAAAADTSFAAWTLADFSGKRVSTPAGKEIGTIESVVADVGGNLHLVTAVDAMAGDGREKVVPLGHFSPQEAKAGLTLTGTTEADLQAMADYDSVASTYALVDSTAALHARLATAAGAY